MTTIDTTTYETQTGPQATQIVETVDAIEPEFVAFVRRLALRLDPTFPQTPAERGPKERGQWTNDDGTVTYMQTVRELDGDGRGVRTVRMIDQVTPGGPNNGALRIIAIGLANDAKLELRWDIVISAADVRGQSVELAVDGLNKGMCIADFREWIRGATAVQDEIPQNNRVGRLLAHGRFEVTQWIGVDFLMGVAIARDLQQGHRVRLTFAGDVSRTADELRSILTRDVPGLAPVLYLGATAADDGWASTSMMMVEALPPGEPLDLEANAGDAARIAAFGAQLAGLVAGVHRAGTILGTLRPESTFIDGNGDITLIARGERLWLMPRPNMTKPAMIPPWRGGYRSPEVMLQPLLNHPDPAADVFSIGVMLASWLLGRFPFEGSELQILMAQLKGQHVPLPATPLGDLLAQCLLPEAAGRPSVLELARALSSR